ncbi:MAG: ABC transporter permease [Proteobacteria bacterium]|nr:ABC transporter permease [Pseudomonadota bacterium]
MPKRLGLLLAVTALAALPGARAVSGRWSDAPVFVSVFWLLALCIAAAAAVRGLEPPRDVRVGPLSPILAGVLSAGLVFWNPSVVGVTLAVVPLALATHLRVLHAVRRSLLDVPFEQWEAAWLLGASRSQAIRHVALPAANKLRGRLAKAGAEVALGLAPTLAVLVLT